MRNTEYSRKTRRRQKKRKKVLMMAVSLALFFVVISSAYVLTKIQTLNNTADIITSDVGNRTNEEANQIIKNAKPINILLLGIDNGAYGRGVDNGRSDTMLLLTLNPSAKKSQLLSIPRDTYTEIVGKNYYDKINHAYAFGQVKMAADSVEKLLDTEIDFYVEINMEGLMDFVNAVGGIEVTSPLTFTYEGRHFEEGKTELLDGESALRFARMRYDDPEGDYGRQKRQRIVIEALAGKLMSVNAVTKYEEIMQAMSKNVRTDVPIKQALTLKNSYAPAFDNLTQIFITEHGFSLTNNMGENIYYSYADDRELLEKSNSIRQLMGKPTVQTYPLLQQRQDMSMYLVD